MYAVCISVCFGEVSQIWLCMDVPFLVVSVSRNITSVV